MNMKNLNSTQKITISAMMMALYIVVMYITQSFAFGAVQIRIATALYALAYLFPFLVLPFGLSNCLSNLLFGGMGIADILGGLIVGLITAGISAYMGKKNVKYYFVAIPVILVPSLGVATWLSYLLNIPYVALAPSLVLGQIVPGIFGAVLVRVLGSVLLGKEEHAK
jgi:hypothetical protein